MILREGVSGAWELKKFTVTKADLISQMGSMWRTGRYVPEGEYFSLTKNGALWMSNTPDELRDHSPFIFSAKGNCLVNGLGIGMCISAAFDKPGSSVEHITIVEIDADVISLVGPQLMEQYPGRVTIVQADALEYRPQKGSRFDAVWHDIWRDICTDNITQMKTLHRKYGKFCQWQGSWSRPQIEQSLRRSTRYRYAY